MKSNFLKISGAKDIDEFYRLFPNEQDFFKAYPEAIKMVQGGSFCAECAGNGIMKKGGDTFQGETEEDLLQQKKTSFLNLIQGNTMKAIAKEEYEAMDNGIMKHGGDVDSYFAQEGTEVNSYGHRPNDYITMFQQAQDNQKEVRVPNNNKKPEGYDKWSDEQKKSFDNYEKNKLGSYNNQGKGMNYFPINYRDNIDAKLSGDLDMFKNPQGIEINRTEQKKGILGKIFAPNTHNYSYEFSRKGNNNREGMPTVPFGEVSKPIPTDVITPQSAYESWKTSGTPLNKGIGPENYSPFDSNGKMYSIPATSVSQENINKDRRMINKDYYSNHINDDNDIRTAQSIRPDYSRPEFMQAPIVNDEEGNNLRRYIGSNPANEPQYRNGGQMFYMAQDGTEIPRINPIRTLSQVDYNTLQDQSIPIRNDQSARLDINQSRRYNPEEVVNWSLAGVDVLTNMFNQDDRNAAKKREQELYGAENNFLTRPGGDRGEYGQTGMYTGEFVPNQMTPVQFSGKGPSQYKCGGQYEEGGEYEMTEEELAEFIANGGEVEYID